MSDYINSGATLACLEPFLLIAKSAKGAAAAKLVQDAISAPGVFVFSELLETPSIQELAANEQHKGWLDVLQLFAYGTYQDYKARAAELPKLSAVQETKLKYLTLATLARAARILPYSRLQETLDIHVIRDLEDLIIDAMYQDVIRGKLDQQQSTFEVEWSMGRDVKSDEVKDILAALNNWSRMTGALLQSMDKKIKKIKEEQTENDTLQKKQNTLLRDNIKEVSEKIQPPGQTRPPRSKGRAGEGSFTDAMEIDDRGGLLSGARALGQGSSGSKPQEQVDSPSKMVRKRNRGT